MTSETRHLVAQCRTRSGGVNEIHVLDLSEAGCMVNKRLLSMQTGDRVLIKLNTLGYMPANVVWVEEDEAGLSFEQPLYGPVLEHLQRSFVTSPAA